LRTICFLLLALALIAPGQICLGQTNSSPAATPSLPPPALKLPAEPKQNTPPIPSPVNTNYLTHQASLQGTNQASLEGNPANTAALNRIEQEGLLQHRELTHESQLGSKAAAAVEPEIIHAGRARIYSPIATAIARKNPFCLLDPKLFDISW
jgi:hypothetical protein